jgi:hypothetical protein
VFRWFDSIGLGKAEGELELLKGNSEFYRNTSSSAFRLLRQFSC